jgi:hypothetical protein
MNQRGFQHLHRVLSLLQCNYRIDGEIHPESVAQLIGDELRIDTGLSGEAGVRAAHAEILPIRARPVGVAVE